MCLEGVGICTFFVGEFIIFVTEFRMLLVLAAFCAAFGAIYKLI